MKIQKLIISLAVALISVFAVSCDKEENSDTTKPVINLESPAEGDTLHAGDDYGVHFAMELSDDVALASYKVNIHNAAGHTHSVDMRAEHEHESFEYNKVWEDVAGLLNKYIHHHEIVIPASAEHGEYHFMVYCTDEAGNELYVVRNVYIDECDGHDHDHNSDY